MIVKSTYCLLRTVAASFASSLTYAETGSLPDMRERARGCILVGCKKKKQTDFAQLSTY